jgi:hypothetical protein
MMNEVIRHFDGVVDAFCTGNCAVDFGDREETVFAAVDDADRAWGDQAGKVPGFTPPRDARTAL